MIKIGRCLWVLDIALPLDIQYIYLLDIRYLMGGMRENVCGAG